jgi:hypothetical protein
MFDSGTEVGKSTQQSLFTYSTRVKIDTAYDINKFKVCQLPFVYHRGQNGYDRVTTVHGRRQVSFNAVFKLISKHCIFPQ